MARLASGLDGDALELTPIELLSEPSIRRTADHVMSVDNTPCWVDLILEYLTKSKVLEDKNEARRLKYQANKYIVFNEKLYRRGYAMPYLRCL